MSQPISCSPAVNGKGEIEEEVEKKFPLLDLPNELISHIFSFMRHEDRIALRVNGRLDGIELNGRYYHKPIHVGLNSVYFTDYNGNSFELPIKAEEGKRAIDEMKRVAKNTKYDLVDCKDLSLEDNEVDPEIISGVQEMFPTLCEIKARALCLMENQFKDDSYLLATLKNKSVVIITHAVEGITAEGLFNLYQKIRNEEVDAKCVMLDATEDVWTGFLNLAKEEKFEKRPIQSCSFYTYICLLKGNFELNWTTKDSLMNEGGRFVTIDLHDNKKQWEERKEELFGEKSDYVVDQTDNVDLKDSDR